MKKTLKSLLGIFMAIAMIFGVLCLASCGEEPTPDEYVEDSVKKTTAARRLAGLPDAMEVSEKDALTFTASLKDSDIGSLLDIAVESAIITATYTKNAIKASGEATVDGTTYDMDVAANKDAVAFTSKSVLDGKYYGLDLTKDASDYPDSYLYQMGESANINKFISAVKTAIEEAFSDKKSGKSIDVEAYKAAVVSALTEDGKITMEKNDNGGKDVVITIDNKAVETIIRTVFNKAKDDEALKSLIEDANTLSDKAVISTDLSEYEDDLDELIDEMNKNVKFSAVCTISTDKKDVIQTVSCPVTVQLLSGGEEAEETKIKFSIELDLTESDKSVLTVDLSKLDGAPFEKVELTYKKEYEGNVSKATLSLSAKINKMSIDYELLTFEYDTNTTEYTASLNLGILSTFSSYYAASNGNSTITLTGKLAGSKNDASVTYDELKIDLPNKQATYKIGLEIKVSKTKDSVKVPEFTDVLAMNEEECKKLSSEISKKFVKEGYSNAEK